jgi:transposase InsO family protein/transposase-like protein
MPWQPQAMMDIKREFVALASQAGANRRELCRRFAISPTTGYALLRRHSQEGPQALLPLSRRPHNSPGRTDEQLEQHVLDVRCEQPTWGARKIARRLRDLGLQDVPSPSTVTAILHRHGCISEAATAAAQPWQRFEHGCPNAMWQMDFKGDFMTTQGRCHPLTLIDDHSRYSLAVRACANVSTETVRPLLGQVFQRYGLPARINTDNGAPWGTPRQPRNSLSMLAIWLIRLGIHISHSAPYHPQTNGKIERMHRTLKGDLLSRQTYTDLLDAQRAFEQWRITYNHVRPHDALGLDTPAQRYCASARAYPSTLPPIEYPSGDLVLTVGWNGQARLNKHKFSVSSSLMKLPIAARPDAAYDGCFDLYFCHHRFGRIDLRS